MENPSFSLHQFNGPLDLLIHLIQKEEIDILQISIREIIAQLEATPLEQIDSKAELLPLTASLMLLKSERLIPRGEAFAKQQSDDRMQMLETLIAYCRFKEAASLLAKREATQALLFPRQAPPLPKIDPLVENLSLDALAQQLKEVMVQVAEKKEILLEDEPWQVGPKIAQLETAFQKKPLWYFSEIFENLSCRGEVIVTFLALLECMKMGIIGAYYEEGVLCLKSIS